MRHWQTSPPPAPLPQQARLTDWKSAIDPLSRSPIWHPSRVPLSRSSGASHLTLFRLLRLFGGLFIPSRGLLIPLKEGYLEMARTFRRSG
eukprot:6848079-Prymnesium_polylepis.1